jgi:hypothetical protein
MTVLATVSAALFLLVTLAAPSDGAEPAIKCESGKLKSAGQYASCRLKAHAVAVAKATTPDFSKCDGKLTPKYAKLESSAGAGVCPTEGDESDIRSFVASHTDDVALLLSGGEVASCGNGIVDAGEECDWGNQDGETCESLGYSSNGVLGCVATQCIFDVSQCRRRIAFVTSTVSTGNLGGVTGADAVCAARAAAAGFSGTFRAWIATTFVGDAPARFTQSPFGYERVDGTKIADDWNDFVDGSLDSAIDVTETGIVVSGSVWTGTTSTGQPQGSDCTGFTSTLGSSAVGSIGSADSQWTFAGLAACSGNARLYCFEQ